MTERKGLLPEITWESIKLASDGINKNPNNYIKEKIKQFEDSGDYTLSLFSKLQDEGNARGFGFALTFYGVLEIASIKQHMKMLPKVTSDISDLVEKEIAAKQEGFAYEMIERLREDNNLLAYIVDEELKQTNCLKSVEPVLEMYRMLEIAAEKEFRTLTSNYPC